MSVAGSKMCGDFLPQISFVSLVLYVVTQDTSSRACTKETGLSVLIFILNYSHWGNVIALK